jgi:HlyD family secretion protein
MIHLRRFNTIVVLSLLSSMAGLGIAFADEQETKPGYRTVKVERGDVAATVQATGTLEPEEVVDVGAQVAGQIIEFGKDPNNPKKGVDFNSRVDKGTILAQIDPRPYQLEVTQAKAGQLRALTEHKQEQVRSDQAKTTLERARILETKKAISSEEFDNANGAYELAKLNVAIKEAAIEQAKAILDRAELNLSYCTIRSPIKGVVIDRRVNVGQMVKADLNAPSVFLIASDLKRMQVWAPVNETDIGHVHKGQSVQFRVEAYPKELFHGTVNQVRMNATMVQNVITYTVEINFDNADEKLLPYLTAEVEFEVAKHKNVLLIPNAALRWRPQASQMAPDARDALGKILEANRKKDGNERGIVWIENKGLVRPVAMRLGISDGHITELLEGDIAEGKPVVIGTRVPTPGDGRGAAPAAGKGNGEYTLLVQPGMMSSAGVQFGAGSVTTLTVADAEAIAKHCPTVKAVASLVRSRNQAVYQKRSWVPLYIYGTTPAFLEIRDRQELAKGEPFADKDVRNNSKVCLIGQTLVQELFQGEDPIGKEIWVKNTALKVVGVLARKGPNLMGLDQDDIIVAPWTIVKYRINAPGDGKTPEANTAAPNTLSNLYPANPADSPADNSGKNASVDQIVVGITGPEHAAEAIKEITALLRQRHHTGDGKADDFSVRDMGEMERMMENLKKKP